MAVVLRIKFPPTYPLIYKTVRLDENLTVTNAIKRIAEDLHLPQDDTDHIGLYLPSDVTWLDNNNKLSDYPNLAEVDEIEYKDRRQQADGGGCCIIL